MSPTFTNPLSPPPALAEFVERLSQIKTRQVAIGVSSTLLFRIGPSTFVSCFSSIYRLSCPPPTNHMAFHLVSSSKAPWATCGKSHPRPSPHNPQQRDRRSSARMGQAIWPCCPYDRACRSRTTDVHEARGFTSDSCQGLVAVSSSKYLLPSCYRRTDACHCSQGFSAISLG